MLEAIEALGAAIDLERDVRDGDSSTSATSAPSPPGHADRHRPRAVGRAAHRGQGHGRHPSLPADEGHDRPFWLSTGQAAAPTPIRLPLDAITVSSGFGMRADPFDQPFRGGGRRWSGAAASRGAARSPSRRPAPRPAAKRATTRPLGGPPPAPSPFTNPMIASVNVPTTAGAAGRPHRAGAQWLPAASGQPRADDVHARGRRPRRRHRHADPRRGRRRRRGRPAQRRLRQLDRDRARRPRLTAR